MDEGVEVINKNNPWECDDITDAGSVYRQVPVNKRIVSERGKKYPGENCFLLRDFEDSLSFNLTKYIDVDKNYKLIGITQHNSGDWINYTSFKIFEFPVVFLKSLLKFIKIIHSPVFNGAPSPIGNPNNKAHVSLYCEAFDDGIRAELSDYCLDNNNECAFDVKLIKDEIDDLRARGNDTPFHNYWVF